ncbi:MAG: hypothetical protein JXO22_01330 [Phycisphaerae bacterium]|nr:hypothetical protein [Phycisphaerae bacterium]
MFFAGTFPLTIDAKNRLSIPFQVRDKMMSESDGRSFYVVPGRRPGTLMLYQNKYFETTRGSGRSIDRASAATYEWVQFEYSQCTLIDPDNQGRLLIPERLLKRAKLDREVVLMGVQDHLELWDRQAYEQFEEAGWQGYAENREPAMRELRELDEQAAVAAVPQPTA